MPARYAFNVSVKVDGSLYEALGNAQARYGMETLSEAARMVLVFGLEAMENMSHDPNLERYLKTKKILAAEERMMQTKAAIDSAARMWHETGDENYLRSIAELMPDAPRHRVDAGIETQMKLLGLI